MKKFTTFCFLILICLLFSCNQVQIQNLKPLILVFDSTDNVISNCTGTFDFGDVLLHNNLTETFTIKNSGTSDLILTGTPKIEIFGNDASMFTIDQTSTNSNISPDLTTTFSITFSPTKKGIKYGTILIQNNDTNANPYAFTIKGSTPTRYSFVLNRSDEMYSVHSPSFPVFDRNGNLIANPTKWQVAQSETAQAINTLNSDESFDIITFATQIYICFGSLTNATTNAKNIALGWLFSQGTSGCSNDYDGLKAAFENYGPVDIITYISHGRPDTALSRGCAACSCPQASQLILQDVDGWAAPHISNPYAFELRVIQIGGRPLSYMTELGAKSNASYQLK